MNRLLPKVAGSPVSKKPRSLIRKGTPFSGPAERPDATALRARGQARVDAVAKSYGAQRVFAGCVHPVLSGPAIDRINGSPIERIFCTNTLPLEDKLARADIIDVSKLSGDTIKFGATVTLVDEDTEQKKVWQIVGEPEADAKKGKISIT